MLWRQYSCGYRMGSQGSQTRADLISILVDFDDWQVTEDIFKDLDSLWGPHTVYCFATPTKKIARYFSRYARHRCIYAVVLSIEVLVGSVGLSYSQSSCLYVCSGSQGQPRSSTVEVSRASKEPNNLLPDWILRFLWRAMIRKILDWSV